MSKNFHFLFNLINTWGPYLLVWVVSLLALERCRSTPDSKKYKCNIRRLAVLKQSFHLILTHISALPLHCLFLGYTKIYFGENKLSPSSISVLLQNLPHPIIFLINWFGPPLHFIITSTWTGLVHLASCLFLSTIAHFTLDFSSASVLLTSPIKITRKILLQKARYHLNKLNSNVLTAIQFQIFISFFKNYFIFPSRY